MRLTDVTKHETSARTVLSVVAVLVAVWAQAAAALIWETEVVDDGRLFSTTTDRSLRLDANGYPHIAYGDDHLYYAWFDGTAWHYETADGADNVGRSASLALDAAGFPCVSYYDGASGDLKCAHRDASGWHLETVCSVGGSGDSWSKTSIAVGGSGHPHISYCDVYPNLALKYAHNEGLGWLVETVDTAGDVGEWASLALDGNGYPHISYYDATNDDLKYAYRDSSGWHIETAAAAGNGVGRGSSLALDASGCPHISFIGNLALKYVYRDAAGWHLQVVDWDYCWICYSTSLALDGSGNPHISYFGNNERKYAYHDASGWHTEIVAHGFGSGTSLALDASDCPHISYLAGDLSYAYRGVSGWHTQLVDTQNRVGLYTSLALDASDCPHISYYDDTSTDLKYAHTQGPAWLVETVDAAGSVGEYTSLALDGSGWPHISYYDGTNADLKYACEDASGWHTETVDGAGDVGEHTSLALDGSGSPHISYYDATNGDLKYDGETVDAAGDVGQYTSLALDAAGHPRISYYDATNGDLKYAHNEGLGWMVETVDTGEDVGQYTSLALDGSGCPHISYFYRWYYHYVSYCDLKYAYRDASGWHTETVTVVGVGGDCTSLALDQSGYPHISYYERTGYSSGDLRYAYKDASGWHSETVETGWSGCEGLYTSLRLNASGVPRISYYDPSRNDLKYASGFPASVTLTGELVGGELVLTWSPLPSASAFWVYGASNQAYFLPGFSPGYQHRLAVLSPLFWTWSSSNGVGDPNNNWTYLVVAVDATEQELCRSNSVGEFDFGMTNDKGIYRFAE